MLFNSIAFACFLPVVFVLYWFVTSGRLRMQNTMLVLASYFFYACWDWRFLFLLLFSTALDYISGLQMSTSKNEVTKKFWFVLSIVVNLGFLGVIKYYDFFATSFVSLFHSFGISVSIQTLHIILPVGISFYTFHGLSYVIDCYKNRIKAEKNIVDYALFVSFFPLLVAGPIERATHLLPQLKKPRTFKYEQAVAGLQQILWGLFKKIVIADQCAIVVQTIFAHSEVYSGSTLALGAVFFAFQIYGDFSGYSDIAIGVAKLLGIDLLKNFNYPYFSRNIAEFWRRWHISLSSWFKDYVYIPLGGNRGTQWQTARNVLVIFLVSGFWHGANWTFLCWGLLHALYILPSILHHTHKTTSTFVAQGRLWPSLKEVLQIGMTFSLTTFAWIFFRAENVSQALQIIEEIFSSSLFQLPAFNGKFHALVTLFYIVCCMGVEWSSRAYEFGLVGISKLQSRTLRWSIYYVILFLLVYFAGAPQQFIYFQF